MFTTVLLSTLTVGILDLVAACVFMRTQRISPIRVVQMIASGVLGDRAFQETTVSVPLGVTLHFVIAAALSLFYAVIAQHLPLLLWRPAIAGVLYGLAVHCLMAFIVVPSSRAPRRPFALKRLLVQAVIHIVCVGLPIAEISAHRLARG